MVTVVTQLVIIPSPYLQSFINGQHSDKMSIVVTAVHELLNIGPMMISLVGFGDLINRVKSTIG